MKVWFVTRQQPSRQINMILQVIFMVCVGLFIGWSSFLVIGLVVSQSSLGMHGPSRLLLCPNDLHGLPRWEAPDRWMATILSIALAALRSTMPSKVA